MTESREDKARQFTEEVSVKRGELDLLAMSLEDDEWKMRDDYSPVEAVAKALREFMNRVPLSSAAPVTEQEPCAWRWKDVFEDLHNSGPWHYTKYAPAQYGNKDARKIEPLYPLPWAAPVDRNAVLEEAALRCDSFAKTGREMSRDKDQNRASSAMLQSFAAESCADFIRALKSALPECAPVGYSHLQNTDPVSGLQPPAALPECATPRTDKRSMDLPTFQGWLDFARQLERELADVRKAHADAIKHWIDAEEKLAYANSRNEAELKADRAVTAALSDVPLPSAPTMGMWDDFCAIHKVPFESFNSAAQAMLDGLRRDNSDGRIP